MGILRRRGNDVHGGNTWDGLVVTDWHLCESALMACILRALQTVTSTSGHSSLHKLLPSPIQHPMPIAKGNCVDDTDTGRFQAVCQHVCSCFLFPAANTQITYFRGLNNNLTFYLAICQRQLEYGRLRKVGIWIWSDLWWVSFFLRFWGWEMVIFQLSGFYCIM